VGAGREHSVSSVTSDAFRTQVLVVDDGARRLLATARIKKTRLGLGLPLIFADRKGLKARAYQDVHRTLHRTQHSRHTQKQPASHCFEPKRSPHNLLTSGSTEGALLRFFAA